MFHAFQPSRRRTPRFLAGCAASVLLPPASAQDAADSALTLGTVTIHANAAGPLPARSVFSSQGKNLTDRRYVYAWYDSGSSGCSPGDGRSAYASLNLRF